MCTVLFSTIWYTIHSSLLLVVCELVAIISFVVLQLVLFSLSCLVFVLMSLLMFSPSPVHASSISNSTTASPSSYSCLSILFLCFGFWFYLCSSLTGNSQCRRWSLLWLILFFGNQLPDWPLHCNFWMFECLNITLVKPQTFTNRPETDTLLAWTALFACPVAYSPLDPAHRYLKFFHLTVNCFVLFIDSHHWIKNQHWHSYNYFTLKTICCVNYFSF